jgi:hypothetical protein
MQLDLERVKANVRKADTEDLLDRVTVYREEMEPEALAIITEELRARGVTEDDMRRHERQRHEAGVWREGGLVARCSFCHRPAVERRWGWHHLWGIVPLFPRRFHYCAVHRPRDKPLTAC